MAADTRFPGRTAFALGPETLTNIGTPGTSVAEIEYGDGYRHVTVLDVTVTDAFTTGDNASLVDGYLVYTFPTGLILVESAYMSIGVTATTEQAADTPDVGVGTVIGTGAVSVLSTPSTFEDIITGQTAGGAAGELTVAHLEPTGAQPFFIAAAAAHTVHVNIADAWADDTSADLTCDMVGTLILRWQFAAAL